MLVLDEADELLSAAAAPATRAVLAAAREASSRDGSASSADAAVAPPLRRVWVSATITPPVARAAAEAAAAAPHPPVLLSDAGASAQARSAQPEGSAQQAHRVAPALTHYRLDLPALPALRAAPPAAPAVAPADARAPESAADGATAAAVARLHAALAPKGPILVFAGSGAAAPPLLAALRARSFRAAALTASHPAERRERAAVLRGVRSGRTQVLVTTEMGARGIDLPRVALVVNAGAPPSAGAYLHRAGRAGRCAPGSLAAAPVRSRARAVASRLCFCDCDCALRLRADARCARCVRRVLSSRCVPMRRRRRRWPRRRSLWAFRRARARSHLLSFALISTPLHFF